MAASTVKEPLILHKPELIIESMVNILLRPVLSSIEVQLILLKQLYHSEGAMSSLRNSNVVLAWAWGTGDWPIEAARSPALTD